MSEYTTRNTKHNTSLPLGARPRGRDGAAGAPRGSLVHVLTTGGTIASAAAGPAGAARVITGGEPLLRRAQALGAMPPIQLHDVARMASEDLTPPFWLELAALIRRVAARRDVAGIVVTHGTDTMEETAFFLDLVLDVRPTVALTGAQRPLSDPDSDGPRNLLHAAAVASGRLFRDLGVLVVFNGQIHAARHVTKAHTTAPEAFTSSEAGALGVLEGDRFVLHRRTLPRRVWPAAELPRVDIVPAYPGADGALVQAAVAHGAQGLVVAGFGAGTLTPALRKALAGAVADGVAVVIATRVPQGPAFASVDAEGARSRTTGWGGVLAGSLPPSKARILLMLALANGMRGPALVPVFDELDASQPVAAPGVPVASS